MRINSLGKTEDSLYHDSLFWIGLSNTSQFPLTDFMRSANQWYRKTDSWIWQSVGTWEFDDKNHTDLPIATTPLVNSQQDYELPSSARKIDRVEVLSDEGDYHLVKPLDKSQIKIATSEYYESAGLPKYYDLVGNSIILYPKPSTDYVATTEGLKVYMTREIKEFDVADTATEPGFDSNFHRIISLGASYDFSIANEMEHLKKQRLDKALGELREELQQFYGSRHRDMKTKIRPFVRDAI